MSCVHVLSTGIQPILPIYREAILNGEPELKEVASIALTEVIQITSPDSLKLSVIHVTGPLIRILGDRFAPNVKVAVLNTIGLLLEKVRAAECIHYVTKMDRRLGLLTVYIVL